MLFAIRNTRNTGAELPVELGTRPGPVTKIRYRWVCERSFGLLLNLGTRFRCTIYTMSYAAEPMVGVCDTQYTRCTAVHTADHCVHIFVQPCTHTSGCTTTAVWYSPCIRLHHPVSDSPPLISWEFPCIVKSLWKVPEYIFTMYTKLHSTEVHSRPP